MKKLLALALLAACSLGVSYAQTTAISATVVDSDVTTWANGTWRIDWTPGPSNPKLSAYTNNGSALASSTAFQSGTLNGSGVLVVTVYDSSLTFPTGSGYALTVCSNTSAACSIYNFATAGSTQNISAALTASITAPRFKAVNGTYGYNDGEATLSIATGATYWNVTSNTSRCYTGSAWAACTAGAAGGSVTSVALNGSDNLFNSTPGTAVTVAGNLNPDTQLHTQAANCMVSGPTTGVAAAPTCRALVNADFPGALAPTISALNMTNVPGGAFNTLTGGTNSTAAMVVGTGASLTVSGSGTNTANAFAAPLFAVNPQTATYQVLAADFSASKVITVASGTFIITLVASGTQPTAGQYIDIVNYGTGVVTVARSGQNINGAAGNLTLGTNLASTRVWSDGTNYFAGSTSTIGGLRFGVAGSRIIDTASGGAILISDALVPNVDTGVTLGAIANRWLQIFAGPTGIKLGNGTNGPTITATGSSPNENLVLTSAGTGAITLTKLSTAVNCANGASPAVCTSAPAGAVAIPTGVNSTLVVNTTAVSAASEIILTVDDSLTIGATTCNSTLATLVGGIAITARTAGTSFTISYNGTITTNPVCISYHIIN